MTRRFLLAFTLLATILFSAAAVADWRKEYPEINFAVVPAENEATVTAPWAGRRFSSISTGSLASKSTCALPMTMPR